MIAAAICWLASAPAVGHAQVSVDQSDVEIEIPSVIQLDERDEGPGTDSSIDLANIVQTAAKGVTTVQEAPAIVTVVTEKDIERTGMTSLEQVPENVPGWLRVAPFYSMFPLGVTRGTVQSTLFMKDGVSMVDPIMNVVTVHSQNPIETVKRVELITGPGGVLWGAGSFLGVMSVATKEAHDVDGVEAGVKLGHGNGERGLLRGYAMAGVPDLAGTGTDVFLHTSLESSRGPGFEAPQMYFSSLLPAPNSVNFYGPLTRAEQSRSYLFNASGKLTRGPLTLYWQLPHAERHKPMAFPGNVLREDLPEDDLMNEDGTPACTQELPYLVGGDPCVDKGRVLRNSTQNFFERYAIAEYRDRFAGGRAGVTMRGYFVNFVREFNHLSVLAPSPLVEGGVSFDFNFNSYRSGANFDGDVEISGDLRLLYGFEAFHEWFPNDTSRSRQGAGKETEFLGPYDLSRLPLPCPVGRDPDSGAARTIPGCPLTIIFDASRTVLASYLNPQINLGEDLILDGGVRVQAAPEALGTESYDLTTLFSGALVYELAPGWHTKLNYAEGFRPPFFNNTASNGEAVQLDGDTNLEVETSRSGQIELNARVFKGERRIRELTFRTDYSYTRLDELIQVVEARYQNTAPRGIHSAEFLSRLYLDGGHHVDLGYTWLRVNTEDIGVHRALPEHWFNVGTYFRLAGDWLDLSTNLRVVGAMEDPNRLVEHRFYEENEAGRPVNVDTGMVEELTVSPHEVTLDRLPPIADFSAGLRLRASEKLTLSAFAYNAFSGRFYQPDGFADYTPRLEFVPNPYEDFRFTVSATYQQ